LPTEREVLRVLWDAPGEPLVRSEIHRRMPRLHRPTLGRVGQLLFALHQAGLLEVEKRRAQGSRKAGFYALSGQGRALCRHLGFEREERLVTAAARGKLHACLTGKRLAYRPKTPGKIVTVYGYRSGLGRTTLVAHVAWVLAEQLGESQQLLVMDLDFGGSGLDVFLPQKEAASCRGLAGLLLDYERCAPIKRDLWLRGALRDSRYLLQPFPEVPSLVYLPTGLGSVEGALSATERRRFRELLRAEAELVGFEAESSPGALGFFGHLRALVRESCARALVDSEAGAGLGARIATRMLADDLMLCANAADESPATLAGLRDALGSFLAEWPTGSSSGGVIFLFRLTDRMSHKSFDEWVNRNLVMEDPGTGPQGTYRIEQIVYDARLADPPAISDEGPGRWGSPHFYQHIIAQLEPTFGVERPLELQILLDALDPTKPESLRSIAAGILENAPLKELARWIDWHANEELLPVETDELGQELVRAAFEGQILRLLSKLLGPKAARQLTLTRRERREEDVARALLPR
jgi:hypothetical protein